MVVHRATHNLIRFHYEAGNLPQNGDVLDIGQVEWGYPAKALLDDIHRFAEGEKRERLLNALYAAADRNNVFAVGQIYYDLFFSPKLYHAIDLHGTEVALKYNLNYPIDMKRQYDVVLNNGTSEHIFNIAQVFKTIHDHTKPGGLMVHEMPSTGWYNHGFYNVNPVLVFDLASANKYEIVSAHLCAFTHAQMLELKTAQDGLKCPWPDAVLVFYLRKSQVQSEFVIPQQGVYATLANGHRVTGAP